MNMKVIRYIYASYILSSAIFAASVDVHPDRWCINSPGLSIEWGEAGNDKYISVVDCRDPDKSLLVLPDKITANSKKAFEKIHKERKESVETDSITEFEAWLKNCPDISKQTPVEKDDGLVTAMIHGQDVGLIWTGAGISSRAGIPTLLELYKKLGLRSIPLTHMVEEYGLRVMATRIYYGHVREIIFDFLGGIFRKIKYEPSPAHIAVKDILTLTGAHYITSNLDHLEDSLGYGETVEFKADDSVDKAVLRMRSSKEEITPKWVLIVGLRVDDYGIATWASYKRIPIYYVGPNIPELAVLSEKQSLIAVDWVKADAQEYLPALVQRLKGAKK